MGCHGLTQLSEGVGLDEVELVLPIFEGFVYDTNICAPMNCIMEIRYCLILVA